ncbi:hypothetical protein Trydic_g16731 [Trypoxylus dichotomus]
MEDFKLIKQGAESKLYKERAILSTHTVDNIFPHILSAYEIENKKNYKEIFNKLEDVRARGRKRTMVG